MREDKAGLADPVGVFFMSGARVDGNIGPTRGGSFPLALLEEGNEVANLDDSSLMGKRMERPLLSRVNTGWSLTKGSRCFSVGLPTPHTDRHHLLLSLIHI